MTPSQYLFALLAAILRELLRRLLAPPKAVRNLKATLKRNGNMATATLKWTDVATRTDGTVLAPTDIAGVDIFDTVGGITTKIGTVLGGVQTFTTDVLAVGDHAFTVVTNDTTGHSSTPSNAAAVTVPATLANPSPVTDLSATLNP